MDEPVSEIDKQLQAADVVSLFFAIESHRSKRNISLFLGIFLGIFMLAVIVLYTWSKWFLLIPSVIFLCAATYHANILLLSSELRRRR